MGSINAIETSKRALISNLNGYFIAIEFLCYSKVGELCKNYDDDTWKFMSLTNKGFFIHPVSASKLEIRIEPCYQEVITPEVAGVIASLKVLDELAKRKSHFDFRWYYNNLYDYALQNQDRELILKAIKF